MLNWIKIIYLHINKVISYKEKGLNKEEIKLFIRTELKRLLLIMYMVKSKWETINKKLVENYIYKVWNIKKRNKLNWYKTVIYNFNKNEEINKNIKSKLISNLLEILLTGILIKKNNNNNTNTKKRLSTSKLKKLSIYISKPLIREKINEIEIKFYYYLPAYRFIKLYKRIEQGIILINRKGKNLLKSKLYDILSNTNNILKRTKTSNIIRRIKQRERKLNIKGNYSIKKYNNYTSNFITNKLINNLMLEILNIKRMNKYLEKILLNNRKNTINNIWTTIIENNENNLNKNIIDVKNKEIQDLTLLKSNLIKKVNKNVRFGKKSNIRMNKNIIIFDKLNEINVKINELKWNIKRLSEKNILLLKSRNIRLRFKKLNYLNKYLILNIKNSILNNNDNDNILINDNNLKINENNKRIYLLRRGKKLRLLKRNLFNKIFFTNQSKLFVLRRKWKFRKINSDHILFNNKISMYYLNILLNYRNIKELSKNTKILLQENIENNKILNINNINNELSINNILINNDIEIKKIYKEIVKNTGISKLGKLLETFKYNKSNNWWKLKQKSFFYYYYYNENKKHNKRNGGINVTYKFKNIISRFNTWKKMNSKYSFKTRKVIKRLHTKKWFKNLSLRYKKKQGHVGKNIDMKIKEIKFTGKTFNYIFNKNKNNVLNYSKIYTYYMYNEDLLLPKTEKRATFFEMKKGDWFRMKNKLKQIYLKRKLDSYNKRLNNKNIKKNSNINNNLNNNLNKNKRLNNKNNKNMINMIKSRNYHTLINRKEIRGDNKEMNIKGMRKIILKNNILNIKEASIKNEEIRNVKMRIRNINLLLKRNRSNKEILISKLENNNKKSILNNINLNIDQVFNRIGVLKENNNDININNKISNLSTIIKNIYNKKVVIKGIPLKYEYNNNEILLKLIKKGINKRTRKISRKLRFRLIKRIKMISTKRLMNIYTKEKNTENLFLYSNNKIMNILQPKSEINLVNKVNSRMVLGFMLKLKGKLGSRKGKVRKSKQIIRQGSMEYKLKDNYTLNSIKPNMLNLTSSTQVKEGKIGVLLNISYI